MAELNLYQKLAKIREYVEVMKRDKAAFGYSYVTDTELLAKITAGMKEYNVSLIPSIVPGTTQVIPYRYDKTKTKKDGTVISDTTVYVSEILVSSDAVFTWVNDENPDEKIEVPWVAVGQQADASMAFGAGLTYSYRYFLLKYFGVATPNDDPDNWRSKQKQAEAEAEQRAYAEANKEIESKRKEITELGKEAIGKKKITGPKLRELITSLNPAGGSPGDIADVATADKVIAAIKALKTPKPKKEEPTDAGPESD